MFYHGFDNYMKYAFPEDELKPVSCKPLTRDRANPAHIELNGALGNYSLTHIDSLSTSAILASSPTKIGSKNKALTYFQKGVGALVEPALSRLVLYRLSHPTIHTDTLALPH